MNQVEFELASRMRNAKEDGLCWCCMKRSPMTRTTLCSTCFMNMELDRQMEARMIEERNKERDR